MANPKTGPATLKDLPKAAATPGYVFGSGGPGSIGHIVGEMAKDAMKIEMAHVPYRGGAPMTTDLISGQIPVGIDVITAFVPMVKSGQIRALAVTTPTRSPLLPEVPTVTELGLPQLVAENYFGVSGPAGLPREVTERLAHALAEIESDPAIVKRFAELGITPRKATPVEFTAFVAKQVADWQPAIKAADLKPWTGDALPALRRSVTQDCQVAAPRLAQGPIAVLQITGLVQHQLVRRALPERGRGERCARSLEL